MELTEKEKLRLLCGQGAWNTDDLGGKVKNISMSDGPVGLRKVAREEVYREIPAVAYPATQTLSNTWNRECARLTAEGIADDCIENDVDLLLGPGVNIKRHPLCGRNFEYFSEDPFLAGTLAKEYISALQKSGVGACLKHYACNNLEYNRLQQSSEVDERTLREIYLKPFEIAVEAQPVSVMCSYNRINGVYGSEHKENFRILREEFGFEGAIISDWDAVRDRTAAAKAGLDLEMPFNQRNFDRLSEDYERGEITETEVSTCADRVLKLAENCHNLRGDKTSRRTLEERLALTQTVQEEGIVLLKNNGVLPLKKGLKLSVAGRYAEGEKPYKRSDLFAGGGSSRVNRLSIPKILPYLEAWGEVTYEPAFDEQGMDGVLENPAKAVENASKSDVNIIFAGTGAFLESEGGDRRTMKLHETQVRVILESAKENPNTVVVLIAGSAVDTMEWKDEVSAIVYAGFLGECGGEAIVNVLTGKVNPSGKLSETFPLCLEDVPSANGYISTYATLYREGLDVGYRYFDTYDVPVAFPFGFGLSYSTFEYSNIAYDGVEVSFTLTNVSEVDGKEVSEVYIRPVAPKVYRPKKELKGFSKDLVKAGESVKVAIPVGIDDLKYYSVAKKCWTVDDGVYEICVCASVSDVKLSKKIVVEKGKIVL